MTKLAKALIGLLFGLLLTAIPVFGQAEAGSISGTVKDPSGAVIPGATIVCPAVTCPNGAIDFTTDASGNFIVAAYSGLVKITQAGTSSIISSAPEGSQWVSVAVDSAGFYIVADNEAHRVVRISPTGTVVPVAPYSITNSENAEHVFVRIDSQGNYIVAEDNGGQANIFRIN